ncbi:MAG TPA: tRNA pseudouridine(55) synthase TruB [Bacillota bacterium]|nr:tRNA pseudouridine(55) synthase TruB [Bacillota bacterium]
MDGIIGIDKPAGLTSFDIVARLRNATGERRIGHTGTLDPDATGVLVICIGSATRISSRLMHGTKRYSAEICFGTSTDTADASGEMLDSSPYMSIASSSFAAALSGFIGEIVQKPPMYSAVKVGGKKLYELARHGLTVDRPGREVTISELKASLPEGKDRILFGDRVPLEIECSHGTYIRTLCEDIGRSLGVPSHMSSLRRTWSSGWAEEDCLGLEQALELARKGELQPRLKDISSALPWMQAIALDKAELKLVCNGGSIAAYSLEGATEVLLVGPGGRAAAIAEVHRLPSNAPDKSILKPKTVFIKPEETANA